MCVHARGTITHPNRISTRMLRGVAAATTLGHRAAAARNARGRFAHSLPKHTIFLPAGSTPSCPAQRTLPAGDRPTACLFGWVGCREKAMRKYTSLYTQRGIDVVAMLLRPEHVYKPVSQGLRSTDHVVLALGAAPARGLPAWAGPERAVQRTTRPWRYALPNSKRS